MDKFLKMTRDIFFNAQSRTTNISHTAQIFLKRGGSLAALHGLPMTIVFDRL